MLLWHKNSSQWCRQFLCGASGAYLHRIWKTRRFSLKGCHTGGKWEADKYSPLICSIDRAFTRHLYKASADNKLHSTSANVLNMIKTLVDDHSGPIESFVPEPQSLAYWSCGMELLLIVPTNDYRWLWRLRHSPALTNEISCLLYSHSNRRISFVVHPFFRPSLIMKSSVTLWESTSTL